MKSSADRPRSVNEVKLEQSSMVLVHEQTPLLSINRSLVDVVIVGMDLIDEIRTGKRIAKKVIFSIVF